LASGKEKESEDFVRSNLVGNISPKFYYFDDTSKVAKQRFVDVDINKSYLLDSMGFFILFTPKNS
tara:strand:+ start:70 stop:264 length:195 start_codon:yes stop_codon:yes gene_type:complete